jgi:hypothetical protein
VVVEVETRALSIPALSKDAENRLTLIADLYGQGITSAQIAELFNVAGVRTPRGRSYTEENVSMSLVKWRRRKKRELDTTMFIFPPELVYEEKETNDD